MTKIKFGILMDSIATIHMEKDSSFAMLLEAQRRGWEIYYFEQHDIFLRDGHVLANSKMLRVQDDPEHWFDFTAEEPILLESLDVIFMRKDPPFTLEYIYTTYLLEQAERRGVLVVNKPQALRDANEKLFTLWFPQCCPPTLVTRDMKLLREFWREQEEIVCKPLGGMGGDSIFCLKAHDINASVVFETSTALGTRYTMAQRFVPEITLGDKRILLINGEPVSHALARIPAPGELRGNLAAGGTGVAVPLSARDRWICEQVGPMLREKGLYFVGLDVIGDYLTEINVTSPTCIRQLDQQCNLNISATLLDCISKELSLKN